MTYYDVISAFKNLLSVYCLLIVYNDCLNSFTFSVANVGPEGAGPISIHAEEVVPEGQPLEAGAQRARVRPDEAAEDSGPQRQPHPAAGREPPRRTSPPPDRLRRQQPLQLRHHRPVPARPPPAQGVARCGTGQGNHLRRAEMHGPAPQAAPHPVAAQEAGAGQGREVRATADPAAAGLRRGNDGGGEEAGRGSDGDSRKPDGLRQPGVQGFVVDETFFEPLIGGFNNFVVCV